MSRRRLPLTLAVVGVLIILAAIIAAAMERSSDTATVALGERLDVPVVITEPGVLDAVGSEVTVRATAADDEPVVLAVGRSSDVEAWLGESDHARVTGLSSWEELTVEVVTAVEAPTDEATDAPADGAEGGAALPNPAGSDLWVVQAVSTGTAELTWTDSPGRWSLVAATDGTGPAPEVELEWGRQIDTPWLVPAIVIGVIALVAGVTMLVLARRRRDDARLRTEAGEVDEAMTTETDPETGERLTRRQLREREREMARAERDLRDGHAGAPPVPLAPEPVGDVDGARGATADEVHTATDADVAAAEEPDVTVTDADAGVTTEDAATSDTGGASSGATAATPRDRSATDPGPTAQPDQHDDREER